MRVGRYVIHHRTSGSGRRFSLGAPALAIALLASPVLSGCTPTVETHGYSLDEQQIAKIKPGSMTRQEVLQLLGSPSALSTFDDDAWYYVSQRTEKTSFYQEGVVAQEVVTVLFDQEGNVQSIDQHGLDQVASIEPVDRVTPTAGSSPSVVKQLIGNIGRFGDSTSTDPDG
ncbi:MAG: outer membrane protein assembly factor BamE [Geminicoccaceae bacterium]